MNLSKSRVSILLINIGASLLGGTGVRTSRPGPTDQCFGFQHEVSQGEWRSCKRIYGGASGANGLDQDFGAMFLICRP
jgi:hypothetical protein